jgi:hypothetical protein
MTKSRIALSKIDCSALLHDTGRPLAESNKPRLALSQEEHPGKPGPPSADEQTKRHLALVKNFRPEIVKVFSFFLFCGLAY